MGHKTQIDLTKYKEFPTVMDASNETGMNIYAIYNSIYHHDFEKIKKKKSKPACIWKNK